LEKWGELGLEVGMKNELMQNEKLVEMEYWKIKFCIKFGAEKEKYCLTK